MRVLVVALHKGGVAKTTTAVNLAAGLAQAGHRTLLVDADAQAHATEMFIPDEDTIGGDLSDVLVRRHPITKVIQPTRIACLDLLPATLGLARLEIDLVSMTQREFQLRRAVTQLANDYTYVVVDTAPSLSLLSINALAAASDLIVPVAAQYRAVKALRMFLNWVEDFRDEDVVTAELAGTLVTLHDGRTRVARHVVEALAGRSDLRLFNSVIPRRIGVEDEVAGRRVLGDDGTTPEVATAYRSLTQEVLDRTGNPRG